MTGFFASPVALWTSVALLVLAAVIVIVIAALPGRPKVALERRRPDGTGPGTLERAATASTASVERWLEGHDGGAEVLLERAGVKQPLQNLIILTGSAMLGTAALGLLLATRQNLSVLGPLWLTMRSARTVREALQEIGGTP